MQIPLYWNDSRIGLNTRMVDGDNPEENRWYYIDPEWKHEIWCGATTFGSLMSQVGKLLTSFFFLQQNDRFPNFLIANMLEFDTFGSIRTNEMMMITTMNDLR